MKKTLLFLMAAMCAVSMNAQNHIMRVWRGGEKLFETKIEETDSITFQQLKGFDNKPLDPANATFTYDNWRNVDTIYIYSDSHDWLLLYLPWNPDYSNTNIPDAYMFPNDEVVKDKNNNTTPRWELAFNTCYDRGLMGPRMFGLWDMTGQIMRIYTFVETLPAEATYCYWEISSNDTNDTIFIDNESKMWQPSDSLFKNDTGFNIGAISEENARPSGTSCRILPITGTLKSGQVGLGWMCFELKFSSGIFDIPMGKTHRMDFVLTGVKDYDLKFSGTINGYMSEHNGTLTIPGNKYKVASGVLTSVGSLFSDISSTISGAISINNEEDFGWALASGLTGAAGAAVSFAGNVMNANEEGKDQEYKLDLDFNISEQADFTGKLTSTTPTTLPEISIAYSKLFGEVLKHRPKSSRVNSKGDTLVAIGVWNLKKQPVLYVCRDASFATPYGKEANLHDNVLASFLDPTSIELMINPDNILFDRDNVKKVSLLAYDFVFVDSLYNVSAQPYYKFYNIPQEQIDNEGTHHWLFPLGEDGYKKFLLETDADYEVLGESRLFQYAGVTVKLAPNDPDTLKLSMNRYNQVYSPAICPPQRVISPTLNLNTIGVSVVVEIEFEDGSKRIFAERFLPEIRSFSIYDAPELVQKLQNASVPTMEDIEMEMPLFEKQRDKACRVLAPLAEAISEPYPFVFIESVPTYYINWYTVPYNYGLGMRVRDYKDENTPGIVIRTYNYTEHTYPYSYTTYSGATMNALRNHLQSLNDWDTINRRLEQVGMASLDNLYVVDRNYSTFGYNIQKGVGDAYGHINYCIEIYHEDKDGNLTLVTE